MQARWIAGLSEYNTLTGKVLGIKGFGLLKGLSRSHATGERCKIGKQGAAVKNENNQTEAERKRENLNNLFQSYTFLPK